MFNKNKPYGMTNGWGIKKDWAEFLDERNYQNVYPFIEELINREILVRDKIVLRNKKEETKYKLNNQINIIAGMREYRKKLHKFIEETEEFQLFNELYTMF
jgi:hypothetical protein